MSPVRKLVKGGITIFIGGYLSLALGRIIFGLCNPASKLCQKDPSIWFYAAFAGALILIFAGAFRVYTFAAMTRQIVREVWGADQSVTKSTVPSAIAPIKKKKIEARFLMPGFEETFHAHLTAFDYQGARQLLEACSGACDEKLKQACHDASRVGVTISGWEKIVPFLRTCEREGPPITALGIDLSWHNGYVENTEPAIEVNAYSDQSFPFSESSHDALVALLVDPQSDRPWQGGFEDIDGSILVTNGLAQLHTMIEQMKEVYDSAADSICVTECWRRLLFEEQIVLGLQKGLLDRQIPVIIGAHDMAPFIDTPWCPEASRLPPATIG